MPTRESPWRHATTFVEGYEGVQLDRRFEEQNLKNLFCMLNQNVDLRRSFLAPLEGLIQSKDPKVQKQFRRNASKIYNQRRPLQQRYGSYAGRERAHENIV